MHYRTARCVTDVSLQLQLSSVELIVCEAVYEYQYEGSQSYACGHGPRPVASALSWDGARFNRCYVIRLPHVVCNTNAMPTLSYSSCFTNVCFISAKFQVFA